MFGIPLDNVLNYSFGVTSVGFLVGAIVAMFLLIAWMKNIF